ncbi:MAG TPA: hypothetical protein DCQ26_18915 [Marinilabiliales bacterium]|nr:MAG: hypothetical protein A2W95_12275 [Bacteroidetes bacterium GWA2_40_14]OFX61351.1 MAG: hypothetical protein A2W84_11085 [Bacteroidetes bacterium GWC2_40_13]OFX73468.1 MAG: hypothetical protein A2W96_10970 [Bacteroidetes bacterium GWD2_40_43]OFX90632.1 MAG: hypothetical protein A2W97_02560 [Bacteroidetes bacterium GWE2_40_63]OFY20891.1 MAG: hypothetical protein A2W88_17705 [Bacteroidetes bacterium GWF2_40_13]OFZ23690.1 MAG: hypothetical protein A2437_06535 [Bacteroidetes bacterium RIFOXYC
MKKLFALFGACLLFFGCSQEDSENLNALQIKTFEMNQNCFSYIKLDQAEIVITNASDYRVFEDSIRVYWFQSCDTAHLPEIGFDTAFFVGKYTQVPGCSARYESQAFYNPESDSYKFQISAIGIGTCEKLNSAFNCAIIPKQSENYTVQMEVEYYQE